MESYIDTHPEMGRMLWLEEQDIRIGIALDYGIRVRHLSIKGMENLYYVQPADLSDGLFTQDGWKLRGGHRLWMTPECDESYYPDNTPVHYTLKADGVVIRQDVEPTLGIEKSLEITFRPDGTVSLFHNFRNCNDHPITGASWGINTLDGSGKVHIDFPAGHNGYAPHRVIALWNETNLLDPRLTLQKDSIDATFMPLTDYFKLGVYNAAGSAVLESKGQRLEMTFAVPEVTALPDHGCNFELYMAQTFLEMETLGAVSRLEPGQSATHWECWKLTRL